mgnify:CR=1 FL=1
MTATRPHHTLQQGQVQRSYVMADRGARPVIRGWFHFGAAILSALAAAVLITFAWMTLQWVQALGVTMYGAGLFLLFGVSAMYHRWPWRTASAVQSVSYTHLTLPTSDLV